MYVIKCTYAVRRANLIPMTFKLRRFVKPDCLSIALHNSDHWFHVNTSPPLTEYAPWAKELLEMSVVKTVQFTYAVGWDMRAKSWNGKVMQIDKSKVSSLKVCMKPFVVHCSRILYIQQVNRRVDTTPMVSGQRPTVVKTSHVGTRLPRHYLLVISHL